MNLKSLSPTELLSQTQIIIKEERKATIKVLRHFMEIERRRAFDGYRSLFELATEHFRYSGGAAHRRIEAMRVLRDFPEFEDKFVSGELSLTAASSLQSYFRRAKPVRAEKVDLIKTCLNKSTRAVNNVIATLEPKADKRTDVRYSSNKRVRLSLNISEDLHQSLEKRKYHMRCKTVEEVIEKLDAAFDLNGNILLPAAASVSAKSLLPAQKSVSAASSFPAVKSLPALEKLAPLPSRHIPSVTKKITLKKCEPKCAYIDPETREGCSNTENLEFDHIRPFSKGGPHLAENLRLLCSHHNKVMWHTVQKNM